MDPKGDPCAVSRSKSTSGEPDSRGLSVGGWMPWTIIDTSHTIGRASHGEQEIADSIDPDDDRVPA